jgi:hypothetical protein
MKLLKDKPWLVIVFAFVALILLWVWFIRLAIKHQPEEIPAQKPGAGESRGVLGHDGSSH